MLYIVDNSGWGRGYPQVRVGDWELSWVKQVRLKPMNHTTDFLEFISTSPSSFHAARNVAQRLEDAGFSEQLRTHAWRGTPGGHVLVDGGAVLAWYIPENAGPDSAFRIIGAHTDSPGFKLKPHADIQSAGWQQAAVEVYGGPILGSWFDRELTLAGQVHLTDGSTRLVNTGAVLRIPNLAIHLDRSDDRKIARQEHTQPIHALSENGRPILEIIAEAAGPDVAPKDIIGTDLITCDTQAPTVFGSEGDLIAAGRCDNLTSVHAAVTALVRAVESGDLGDDIAVIACFDHEEIGSSTPQGAGGPLLGEVLRRTARSLGADDEAFDQMLARSSCVSADAAHAVHPNFVAKSDPGHHPMINAGPVAKVNANHRYATDADSLGMWQRVLQIAGVPGQLTVNNNNVPCGSTIGPISATRWGISTVDVGVPLLSMHSARELVGVSDQLWFSQALEAYLVS